MDGWMDGCSGRLGRGLLPPRRPSLPSPVASAAPDWFEWANFPSITEIVSTLRHSFLRFESDTSPPSHPSQVPALVVDGPAASPCVRGSTAALDNRRGPVHSGRLQAAVEESLLEWREEKRG
eukprot:GHVU01008893.1.p1 GENE.GHVU01008893.1~~GHVU01008893.1.p1  ORF type:complete len:122 (+),score=16.19 GHVU01008893.1:1196-1561(+)